MSTNSTHRKTLAKALSAQTGEPHAAAMQRIIAASEAGLLPSRLDDAGLEAALRILTTEQPLPVSAPTSSDPVESRGSDAGDWAPIRRTASSPADQEIWDLSFEYETLTGKQGLLYISSPSGADRYVFGDNFTALGRREALDHISGLVITARRDAHATTAEERLHLEPDHLKLLWQVGRGLVCLEVARGRDGQTRSQFTFCNKRVSDLDEIKLRWLLDNDYINARLFTGEDWVIARTSAFGDEVLAHHTEQVDRFAAEAVGSKR